jgi:Fe-S cluster biogenesis protein NfuA
MNKILNVTLHYKTETTPNEDSLKFIPGEPLSTTGQTHEFMSSQEARISPLASALFDIPGVRLVFFGPDFISVSKTEDSTWALMKPEIYSVIIEHFSQGKQLFYEGREEGEGPADTRILDTDSEVVAMIKELLDTRVRPAIQEDGGDIEYKGFDEESGMVRVSCRGCESSAVTLKSGIERMLCHYVSFPRATSSCE